MFGNPERVYVTTAKIYNIGSADIVEFFGVGSHSINQVRISAVRYIDPGPTDPKDPDKEDPKKEDPDKEDPDKEDPKKKDSDKGDPEKKNPDPSPNGGNKPNTNNNPGPGTNTNYDPGSSPGDEGGNVPDGSIAIAEPETPQSPPSILDEPEVIEKDVPLSLVPKTNASSTLPFWGLGGIISLLMAIRSINYLRKGNKSKK